MKSFFLIILSFLLLNLVSNARAHASSMKLEGSCRGTLKDGSPVSFKYYSTFNGCTQSSKGAVTFTRGLEGLLTGKRAFTETRDIYSFTDYKISLANSTGNTSARFTYPDENGTARTVTVQCEVRDYEYGEC